MMEDKIDRAWQKERYLDGIRRYRQKGIKILFDGEERPEHAWEDLFQVSEDGGFYQSHYIVSEEGALTEIRFDWVCYKTV